MPSMYSVTYPGKTFRLLSTAVLLLQLSTFAEETTLHDADVPHDCTEQCSVRDIAADEGFVAPQSPDFFEVNPDGSLPQPESPAAGPAKLTALSPAARQPIGALTGKIVFTSGGHGWTYANGSESITRWYTQRGVTQEMNEDYGNMDQMTLFAYYCFNAGATVVPLRPVGHQTNEVVIDNVSASVTWSGTWSDSTSSIYYGAAGQTPYRYASIASSETATATYTPNIPVAGFYPVYAWTRHGSDRTSQLYKIRHTGGESHVRVPHEKVGNGWVYLGSYYFTNGVNSGMGAVVISNLRPSPTYGSVVIADAIRFGNGMGDVVPSPKGTETPPVSSYPREEEASRYWVQRGLGRGQSTTIYNPGGSDNDDNVGTPPRMAREMNRQEAGILADRVYVGFHSNAGGGRGCVGLYNNENLFPGTSTPNQQRLALLVATEVDSDMKVLPLEIPWQSRTLAYARSDYAFGEIRGSSLATSNIVEMDATIIEVAFHDHADDAKLLRDPKVRGWMARSSYQGIVRYFDEFDPDFVPVYMPEPPQNVRAIASATGITISWNPPIASRRSGTTTNYVVYRSTDGYGFGNPVSVGTATSITLTDVASDTDLYFRVAAANAGGESLPSEVAGCRRSSNSNAPRVLVVNAFPRIDRFTNLRHTPTANAWKAPGNSGTMERILPRANNSFDYAVAYGKAISAHGMAFDTCYKTAVTGNQVTLTNYAVVIWAAGQELTGTIDATAQSRLTTYLQTGRGLFVSGSEIAGELGRASSPAASRSFMQNQLRVTLASDAHTNAQSYAGSAVAGSIFAGNSSIAIDDGTKGIYWVRTPDVLTPSGGGSSAAINYTSGLGGAAAVQYNGTSGGGRVVFFGFPFETITLSARRNAYMADILTFLGVPPPVGLPVIVTQPVSQTVNRGWDVEFSTAATGTAPIYFQWRFNGINIPGETDNTLTLLNVQTNQAGLYSVVVSNEVGTATSSPATLTVKIAYESLFTDTFDTNSAALWITNRSSTDTRVTFNYNYANDSIPPAPNSLGVVGGTMRGVKFEANMTSGLTNAINISPSGKSFTGDYDLRFDMWINANGPFPGGGTGSTEHLTAGVGTTGTRTQWRGNGLAADGTWFAVDGEGQATDTSATIPDFMVFLGNTLQSTNTGFYSAGTAGNARGNLHPYYAAPFPAGQTAPGGQLASHPAQSGALDAGCVGFKWREVKVSKRGTTVDWHIDNTRIASVTNATFSGNNIFVGYWDAFASISDNTAMSFGLIDNLRVERATEVVKPVILAQPQNRSIIQGSNALFTVSTSGSATLSYQWRFNEVTIPGATSTSYTVSNVQPASEGEYSVMVTNMAGKVISANATLTVVVPPSIVSQPESQSIRIGENAGFSVEVAGSEPITFQWLFNGSPISGATENTLALTNAQPAQAGDYSVVVNNAAGVVTSEPATLFVQPPDDTKFGTFAMNEEGKLQLLIEGEPGRAFVIQTSTNLVNWTTYTNLVIGDEGTAELTEDLLPGENQRFYRTVEE